MHTYDLKGKDKNGIDDCLTGWYYYQLNEYYQVANTAIFNGCLDYLQELSGPGWLPMQELLMSCQWEIIKFLIKEKSISSDKITIETIIQTKFNTEKKIYENISGNLKALISSSIILPIYWRPAQKKI